MQQFQTPSAKAKELRIKDTVDGHTRSHISLINLRLVEEENTTPDWELFKI